MRAKGRPDRRWIALALLPFLLAGLAAVVSRVPGRGIDAARVAEAATRHGGDDFSRLKPFDATPPSGPEIAARSALRPPDANARILADARALLGARQPEQAIALLNANREALRGRAEAYLLLGRALEDKQENAVARDFYSAALDRNPLLPDAYWGIATTSENLGDLEVALGAMRSYLHSEPDQDPRRLRINQARAAIWEWEAKLGRGPWGPTRGIPPGFSADELKRDGRGVGVKMPLAETLKPDGTWNYEIKHADKIKIYPRP